MDIGSSYLPSELVSAFLYAQMEQAEQIIAKRRTLFDLYYDLLKPLEDDGFIRLPYIGSDCTSNGHIFYIVSNSLTERIMLIAHLKLAGIYAVFHYVPLHSSYGGKQFGRVSGTMDVTDNISDRLLRLPLYYEMSDVDVRFVAKNIDEFYRTL